MLTVTRHILVSAPKERVSEYLRDATRLADYEQKVDQCKVTYPDAETALAEVSGRYFGVPWSGSFKMVYTGDGGYQSEMLKGPFRKGLGGFELTKGRGSDAQSTAWAIQGLLAAGRVPPHAAFHYLGTMHRPDGSYRYSAQYVTTPVWVTAQVLAALARKTFPLS